VRVGPASGLAPAAALRDQDLRKESERLRWGQVRWRFALGGQLGEIRAIWSKEGGVLVS